MGDGRAVARRRRRRRRCGRRRRGRAHRRRRGAGGRGGRRRRVPDEAAKLGFQVILGAGLIDAGAPELVRDKEQQQDAECDQAASDERNHPPHPTILGTGPPRTPARGSPGFRNAPYTLGSPVTEQLVLVVRLRSAVCLLDRFPALAGVDLDVAAGEVVLLSGANGAGKTTLLRLIAGLLPLRAGEAEVLGVDLAVDRRSHRRHLALLGHENFCYDDLTVSENLRFATRAAGGSEQAALSGLARLGLEGVESVTHWTRDRACSQSPAAAARRAARRPRRRGTRGAR
ncbi:MAG: ATP-binding cassette domain-containing protein [Actinobacteria bacterium]|nr:MAG: ATP-binding cassette domain-containing protein [Actinomycetota bacterium]